MSSSAFFRHEIGAILPKNKGARAAIFAAPFLVFALSAQFVVLNGDTFSSLLGPFSDYAKSPLSEGHASYPRARWRLARNKLEHVRLRYAHILISHDQAEPDFHITLPFKPPTRRTKSQALDKALELSSFLRKHPQQFEQYAVKYSDDVLTASMGGRRGVVSGLYLPNVFLDALAAIKHNEVSSPVETSLGYHIIKKLDVPPEQRLSYSRLLVGYGTPHFDVSILRRGRAIERSRNEAFSIATGIYRKVSKAPQLFEHMVDKCSDHFDAIDKGYVGTFSNYDPGRGSELEAVSHLDVGGISRPLDTLYGVVLLKRLRIVQMKPAYVSRIFVSKVRHSSSGKQSDSSNAKNPQELVEKILEKVRSDPSLFADFQKSYCCVSDDGAYMDANTVAGMRGVADSLEVGQIADEYVELPDGYYILRKEPPPFPGKEPRPRYLFELPNPKKIDIEDMIENLHGPILSGITEKVTDAAKEEVFMNEDERSRFDYTVDRLAERFEKGSPNERRQAFAQARLELLHLLGKERMKAYERFVDEWLVDYVLTHEF